MPHKIVRPPGSTRSRTLGWLALWWIETFVVHGPGDVQGEPVRHGDEYSTFVVDCYALDADGGRLVDSAFFSRPKGCDKSGLGSRLVLFEALGPCRFAGWAQGGETYTFLGQTYTYEKGEPMGKPVSTPYVRILATEEGQTGNVYDTIYFNLTDGPLAELKAYGLDCGLTRVALPYGGEITPSTAGASSKDGGKETFVVADESHLYNTKALREMHSTVTRNLVKRKKSAGTWYLETTTMYLPGEESVAEATYKYMQLVEESMQAVANGKKPKLRGRIRMLFDHRWSDLVDLSDEQKLAGAVAEAYGEAMDWNSLEGVVDKIFDPRTTPSESRRYYLNALTEASNAWLTPAEIARVSDGMPVKMGGCLRKGDRIALGFDGAQTNDATALVACRIEDGTVDPLLIIEKPDGPEAEDWRVDEVAVDAAVAHAFSEYKVEAFFADPPHWQDRIDAWELEYGERLAVKAGHDAIRWWTKRDAPMALALERFHLNLTATENGAPMVRMSANPVFVRHMTNARRWPRRGGVVIGKEGKNSVRKMDAAMAATLAFEARARVLAGGEAPEDDFVPFKVGARPSPPAAGERGRLARRAALRQRLASMQ